MAIQYVGGQTATLNTASTAITFALAGGLASIPANGDVVVVTIGVANTVDRSIGVISPSGYVELAELYANDAVDSNLSVSWKRMGSTPDTSVTVTGTSASADGGIAVIQVFRGVDATTPFDVTSTPATLINTAIPDPSLITPITSGAVILISGMSAHTRGSTGTLSASYLTNFISAIDSSTNDATVGMGYVEGTSGTYNPAAWTFGGADSTSYSAATLTMALRPAVTTDALTSTDITTAAPTLDAATIAQTHALSGTNVETSSPTLDTATLVATSILDATGVTAGIPTLDATTLAQTHIVASVAITAGTPTLGAPTLAVEAGNHSLTASGITTGVVIVDATTVAQTHALNNTNIVTGTPAVGGTTIHVTSILVSTNVETGAPTLGLPALVAYTNLVAASITTGSPSVGTATISQIHVFTSVPITTGAPVLPLAIAFSQGGFNASYERKRTVWVLTESRTVTVSKDVLPTVVTAERENRTATIQ